MIQIATAGTFQLLLLDVSKRPKPRITSMLANGHQLSEERMRNVRYLRPVAVVLVTSQPNPVPQVTIARFELIKDREKIWVDFGVFEPNISGNLTIVPSNDYDLRPFIRSGRISGTWFVELGISEFPKSILEKPQDREKIFRNLRYTSVFNAAFAWRIVPPDDLSQLDRTGQYRDTQSARNVLGSNESYGIDDI